MRAAETLNRVAPLLVLTQLRRAAKGHPGSPGRSSFPVLARTTPLARAAPLTRAPGNPLTRRPGDTAREGSIQTADSRGRQRNFDAAARTRCGRGNQTSCRCRFTEVPWPAGRKITRHLSSGDRSVLHRRPRAHLAVLDLRVQGKAPGRLRFTARREWQRNSGCLGCWDSALIEPRPYAQCPATAASELSAAGAERLSPFLQRDSSKVEPLLRSDPLL